MNAALPWLLLLFPLFLSCQKKTDENIIARVNGISISKDDFQSRLGEYRLGSNDSLTPSPQVQDFKRYVLNELILERLILEEARLQNVTIDRTELNREVARIEGDLPKGGLEEILREEKITMARWKDNLRDQLILEKMRKKIADTVPQPKEERIKRYYDENQSQFLRKEQIHLQQIVVKTKEDAQKVLYELKKGADFSTLAQSHSFTPEAAQGGDIGILPLESLPEDIQAAVKSLKTHQTSPILETSYGFHVLRILERKPEQVLSFEEARPEIISTLRAREVKRAFSDWKQNLLTKAKIERNHALLSTIH